MTTSPEFWLTRLVFQRGLALIYLIGFLVALNQFCPLLGEHGLLPVPNFVKQVPFRATPSLFFAFPNDRAFISVAWIGILLSCAALTGLSERFGAPISMAVWALLWALYMSFVNVGQTFYAFGWESILLEAGFYAIFLGPRTAAPPKLVIWMLRWLLFRIMFGAGLIKIRGDACWRNLTCLDYHYETQPMPNPLSWYFHWGPEWTHKAGVAFNHIAELVAPFGYFVPGPVSAAAGLVTILFQCLIMASGNLSWLNLMTIVIAIPALNDQWLSKVLPLRPPSLKEPELWFKAAAWAVTALVVILSIDPIRNMLSPNQVMNTNYNALHLVGTYGAFGSITRPRYEVIVEGTDASHITGTTHWREYEFKGKPGNPMRAPSQIAPYHLRLDWLMWFAAMSTYQEHPWFIHLMIKFLENDRATLSLIASNPFPDKPPHYVRAQLYEYHFSTPEEKKRTGAWWKRELIGAYFPPVSLDTPAIQQILRIENWS